MGMKPSALSLALIMGIGMSLQELPPLPALSTPKLTDLKKAKLKKATSKRRDKYNLKKFHYGTEIIWARNKKNADRKARNKGYL